MEDGTEGMVLTKEMHILPLSKGAGISPEGGSEDSEGLREPFFNHCMRVTVK